MARSMSMLLVTRRISFSLHSIYICEADEFEISRLTPSWQAVHIAETDQE
jgi:hypothetical protein